MRYGVWAFAVLLLLAPFSARGEDAAWSEGLSRALAARAFEGAQVSALVVARATGAALFARGAEQARTPASTQKLLTSIAALAALGPAHRFETVLLADAAPDAAGAIGNLYVRGDGDPGLRSEEWWRLAADLRARGVTEVRGELRLDDGAFDAQRWHQDWQPLSTRAYHAPVGALSANYGAFLVRVTPGARAGEAARVVVDPPLSYLRLRAQVNTLARGAGANALRIERVADAGFERVLVSGDVRAGAPPSEFWRSVANPLGYAGAVLQKQLEANGIAVRGPVRAARAPAAGHELLRFRGPPLRRSVALLLKYSNNTMAESLLKVLGARAFETGSWQNGARALRAELAKLGVPLHGAQLVDGSGLSRANRVSARTLVEALRVADANFLFGPELLAALPLAAQDGTLRDRAERSQLRVRAKTGSLQGVNALAGFAQHRSGAEFVFALLVDGYRGDDQAAVRAVDAFAAALVGAK